MEVSPSSSKNETVPDFPSPGEHDCAEDSPRNSAQEVYAKYMKIVSSGTSDMYICTSVDRVKWKSPPPILLLLRAVATVFLMSRLVMNSCLELSVYCFLFINTDTFS